MVVAKQSIVYAGKTIMVDAEGRNLSFICSTPRAGSTLLSRILANHSEAYSYGEPWFLLGLAALWEGKNRTFARYEHSGVETALHELLTEGEFLECARAFALTAYNTKLTHANKRVFIDKTPRNYHILPFIDALFPRSKKIWLMRNPLDVAASYLTSWKITVDQLCDYQGGPMSFDLSLSFLLMTEFFKGQENTLEIHYEDLVQRPAQICETVCQFLGLQPEPELEEYGRTIPRGREYPTLGDDKVYLYSRPHTNSVGGWRHILSHDQVQRILCCIGRRFFVRMGYEDTVDELLRRNHYFPDETTIDGVLSAFRNAAQWLPWAERGT